MPNAAIRTRHFWVINFFVLFAMLLSMAASGLSTAAWAYTLAACAGYALFYLLPLLCLVGLLKKLPLGNKPVAIVAVLGMSLEVILLYVDSMVFSIYGFHFNGFVWNLITTPGGIATMDSSTGTYVTVSAICVGVLVAEALLYGLLVHKFAPSSARLPAWLKWGLAVVLVAIIGEQATFGVSRFMGYSSVMTIAGDIPFYQQTSFSHFLRGLGIKGAQRAKVGSYHFKPNADAQLHYPLHTIKVRANAPTPNIVVLACESLRWDMLTPDIMPNLWKFSQHNWRYTHNLSGGNGTAWGVFSLFYGMPARNYRPFADARQAPALVTTLQKRGYAFGIFTSTSFTYPEFNHTLWVSLPKSDLHADNSRDEPWKNDKVNVTRLNHFIDQQQAAGKPFMSFMFFESSHARYFFPKSAVIRPHYLKAFNYATANIKQDIGLIKNRYINATHELDIQLGRVLRHLKNKGLLNNTIVLIAGDHGEEFMEHGRWGHNSTFHDQQIHTTMVVHVPGRGARVVTAPTSHLDMVPTLMPLIGVTNPVSDYSVDAVSLLTPTHKRYRVLGSWHKQALVTDGYKFVIPMNNAKAGFGMKVTTVNDAPVANKAAILAKEKPKLMRFLLKDTAHFYTDPQ